MGYVFISYSSKNQQQANFLCGLLKERNIDYWIASEHIQGGENYAKVIPSAIKQCACAILLLSEESQQSVYVSNEIDRAINAKKPIFPIKVENCPLTDEFDFYLCRCQIVNAFDIQQDVSALSHIFDAITILTDKGKFLLELPPAKRTNESFEQQEIDAICSVFEDYKIPCQYAHKRIIGRQIVRYYFNQNIDLDKPEKLQHLIFDLQLALHTPIAPTILFEAENNQVFVVVEVVRKDREIVPFEKIYDKLTSKNQGKLAVPLGVDFDNKICFADVEKEHSILIVGATGTGKTQIARNVITTLATTYSPSEVQFVLLDPKGVELTCFANLPHLCQDLPTEGVITNEKDCLFVLSQLHKIVANRHSLFKKYGKRNIDEYNAIAKEKLARIVIVMEELTYLLDIADSQQMTAERVKAHLSSIVEDAKATGIHVILTTQRANVLQKSGMFSASFSTRIILKLPSVADSKTVMDRDDAVHLTGQGDLYFLSAQNQTAVRLQAPHLSQEAINCCLEQSNNT